ncbi:MAG: hypothetical protein M3209_02880 [Acidobacteriota bacterium]|nr:hypothetical protein [Acidobacteriota bacterium]
MRIIANQINPSGTTPATGSYLGSVAFGSKSDLENRIWQTFVAERNCNNGQESNQISVGSGWNI